MKSERDHFVFSNGRRVYANITLHVTGGFDNGIHEDEDFSANERTELADYMIALWTAYKAKKPNRAAS
jgi:hypothetical protein